MKARNARRRDRSRSFLRSPAPNRFALAESRRLTFEPLEERALLALSPTLVDLQAGSDSGLYDDDDLTNISAPTIDIAAAEAGDVIRVYRDDVLLGDATNIADTSYQYSFAPGELAEGDSLITARAFDGLNESEDSPPLVITLDLTVPQVTSTSLGEEGEDRTSVIDRFALEFSEDLVVEAVNDVGNLDLRSSGLDGAFDTEDDEVYVLSSYGYSTGVEASYRITDGPLQSGSYRLVVGGMTDRAGNTLESTFERRFTVSDVAGYQLEDRNNDTLETADPLTLVEDPSGLKWVAARGNLWSDSDRDYWRFSAEAGDILSVA